MIASRRLFILVFCALFFSVCAFKKEKTVLYIIGDSTVRNGDGTGSNGQWGWGSFIAGYFDSSKLHVSNQAIGGRSSRTFITEGRWDKVLSTLNKGDYVIMQFGHNDSGPLDDTARARGTIKGVGEDSIEIYNPIRKVKETVYSYGWYMRKYVKDTRAKGAMAIICSPIPRNEWKDGKVIRSADSYAGWAKTIAKEEGAWFIDLDELVAAQYEALGAGKVTTFFPADHTHTNKEGAELNAGIMMEALRKINPGKISKYLIK